MKKPFCVFLGLVLFIGLSSCTVSYGGNGGEVAANLTALPPPINVNVKDDKYIYWDEVPNASSYIVKVNDYQESAGNALKYSIASIMDSKIEANVATELHIFVKAKGNQILYSDSDWSLECAYTYTKEGSIGTGTQTKTKLKTPTNVDYKDDQIIWNGVENAEYYKIEIKESDKEEAAYYERSSTYLALSFNKSTTFTYRVKAVADEDGDYTDSNWSATQNGEYKINVGETFYTAEYGNKNLGKVINLFNDNATYTTVETGKTSIFDSEKLMRMPVSKNHIRKGEVFASVSNSFEEKIDNYKQEIGAKFSLSKVKSKPTKLVSQKSFGIDISYKNVYTKRTKEQTKVYLKDLQNIWQVDEYYFVGFDDPELFKDTLSSSFIQSARDLQDDYSTTKADRFINKYGTHVITSSVWGAKLEMHYSLIGTDKAVSTAHQNKVDVEQMFSKNRWEESATVNLNFEDDSFKSSKDLNVNVSIRFEGGTNQSVSFTEENISGFNEFYSQWAKTTNEEENLAFVDVKPNSLHCIWDMLPDDEFSSLKDELDNYLLDKASDNYFAMMAKINNYYDDDYDGKIHVTNGNPKTLHDALLPDDDGNYYDVVLDSDIDFTDYDWEIIDSYGGTFDGNNHTLTGFTKTKMAAQATINTDLNWGLIKTITKDGMVKNLNITKGNMTSPSANNSEGNGYINAGFVAVYNEGLIKDVFVTDSRISIERNRSCYGFIAAYVQNGGKIKDCDASDVYIFGNGDQGGIVGTARWNATIEYCTLGKYDPRSTFWYWGTNNPSSRSAGGIVGYCHSSYINECGVGKVIFSLRGGKNNGPSLGLVIGCSDSTTIGTIGTTSDCIRDDIEVGSKCYAHSSGMIGSI